MKKAYRKDIFRSIGRTRKRFISILAITALGVTVLTGIYAACQDMYYSADRFYDEQNLFDIRILSTLGLTDSDVSVLQRIEGIEQAEGAYSETVHTYVNGTKQTAQMTVLSSQGLNMPYIVEGVLPSEAGEIAVTRKYLDNTGKVIGDTLTIEEEPEEDETEAEIRNETKGLSDEEEESVIDWDTEVAIEEEAETPNFLTTTYIITAVVMDPMNISSTDAAFRSSASAVDYTFFITPLDVESDIYTCIYLTLNGVRDYDCYSEEYENAVGDIIKGIETEIKEQREAARYESILAEALEKIQDAESIMDEKFAEADEKFADAWEEIEEARVELADGEETLSKEEKDAYREISEARAELEEARVKLADGEEEIRQGELELADAEKGLKEGERKLSDGRRQFEEGRKEAEAGFAEAESIFAAKQEELNNSRVELETGLVQLQMLFGAGWPKEAWDTLVNAATLITMELSAATPESTPDPNAIAASTSQEQTNLAAAVMMLGSKSDSKSDSESDREIDYSLFIPDCIQSAIGMGIINGGQQMLDAGRAAYEEQKAAALKQLAEGEAAIRKGEAELADGRRQMEEAREDLEKGKKEVADGWQELYDGEEELNREEAKAKREIADAWREIEEGRQELADGEEEIIENQEKYFEKKEEAVQKIADAYEELKDLEMTEWYVQDRDSLDSYSSLKSDMSSIETIGGAFPIVFLVVAILISLTTMTRMVEEERGLIGTYKAMGFSNGAVYLKYVIYALLACVIGGILGDLGGFVALPKFLIFVLKKLYILPEVRLKFDFLYGIMGFLLFTAGIVGATVMVCRSELRQMPAGLMRPKAPRNGSRVFLERLPFIWNKLKFLNKVTVRNLFRYKKRFFMTIFGIMGCTALVLAGFAIKDSVTDLMPKQYEYIYQYDLMAVVAAEDNQEFLEMMKADEKVADYVNLEIGSFKVLNGNNGSESVQVMIVPDGEQLNGYIGLVNADGDPVLLDDSGILLTLNAAELLGVGTGDMVSLQNLKLEQHDVNVRSVIRNYLGNNVYMTQRYYESLFGEYSPNGLLAHLSEECDDQKAYARELLDNEMLLSAVSVERLREDFSSNFALINAVVYVIIILAAGLAFVVLFTLSNTNISERVRELATTKVLGFYDREVHAYVNKETLILTSLGILVGLPVGRFLSSLLTAALKMPAIHFAVHVETISYFFAAIISFCFALIVNLITNRALNSINMVEALKSVE